MNRGQRWIGAFCFTLLSATIASAESTNLPPIVIWDASARITGGLGYRDNVLRSSVVSEGGGFFLTSADATLMRISDSGSLFTLFLLGEDARYFDVPSVGYEQFISGTAQLTTPIGERDEAGLAANYLYQHQILDISETEAIRRRMLVLGHGATVRPHWKHTLNGAWAVKLEGAALRQIYDGDLDDFWEGSGRLSLIHNYGHRSEASVGYQGLLRPYDTREQFDEAGVALAGTSLEYQQHEIGGQWRHNWDEARHWRTTSKLGYMVNHDNGSGWFDYNRLLFSQQVRWVNPLWEFKINARFGRYDYPVQTIRNEKLERSYVMLDARAERRLGKNWLLYAVVEREWNMSNDPFGEYRDWMAGGGVGYDF
jgi:hypothetical protein